MFLVLMRYQSDDLPVAIFQAREAAEKFIINIDDEPIDKISNLLNLDVTTPYCATIIEFAQGSKPPYAMVPVRAVAVRDFTSEDEE